MRITYRAKFDGNLFEGDGTTTGFEASTPTTVWKSIASACGMDTSTPKDLSETVKSLKSMGWEVNRHIDVSTTEEIIGSVVLDKVAGKETGGLIKRLLGKIF